MPARSGLKPISDLHSLPLQRRCTKHFYWSLLLAKFSDTNGAVVAHVTVEITNELTGKVERSINPARLIQFGLRYSF
jgi:hypothetical protein